MACNSTGQEETRNQRAANAASRRSGQFNRKGNFGLVLQINVFTFVLKSEYRIDEYRMLNIEGRHSIDFY